MSIEQIHQQHQALERVTAQLQRKIQGLPFDYEAIDTLILDLIQQHRRHFIYEEMQMAASQYPDYQAHKQAHTACLSDMKLAFEEWQMSREFKPMREFFSVALANRLSEHMDHMDAGVVEHLKGYKPQSAG
ncbi:hemerythrin family protein [Paraferrimonas sedimenticola]|uniref:Hemerythrin-like domain-containing protein n=1 Tax=Paraferrimonas sedimenticola TaxID=375674 RepID=A0AA37RVI2_9GAMM|nr:hemerythrin family protein [Paraferrimonas sedimenticola]GLP96470.1 hypothetical protein GCM10007895_17760 [Paraferrimonas sedimenticola]